MIVDKDPMKQGHADRLLFRQPALYVKAADPDEEPFLMSENAGQQQLKGIAAVKAASPY